MDQVKIGKFIQECRKKENLTQKQLAEKLNVTDKAVSKWENGNGMPDSSIMVGLCNELKINVNELLRGEKIDMKDYNKIAEEKLLELNHRNEKNNKVMKFGMGVIIVFIIISIVELFFIMLQYKKTELNTLLAQANNNYELYNKIDYLEERIIILEESI